MTELNECVIELNRPNKVIIRQETGAEISGEMFAKSFTASTEADSFDVGAYRSRERRSQSIMRRTIVDLEFQVLGEVDFSVPQAGDPFPLRSTERRFADGLSRNLTPVASGLKQMAVHECERTLLSKLPELKRLN